MLDRVLASGDALPAKAGFVRRPAALMVLDSLQYHPQMAATETTIGEQRFEFLASLGVVWPVSTPTRLSREIRLDEIASSVSI